MCLFYVENADTTYGQGSLGVCIVGGEGCARVHTTKTWNVNREEEKMVLERERGGGKTTEHVEEGIEKKGKS